MSLSSLGWYLSSFCWGQELGIYFSHFPLTSIELLLLCGMGFPCFLLPMILISAVLLCYWWLLGGLNCLFSFPWFNYCVVTGLVISYTVDVLFFPWSGSVN
jgi:hypothetical protein